MGCINESRPHFIRVKSMIAPRDGESPYSSRFLLLMLLVGVMPLLGCGDGVRGEAVGPPPGLRDEDVGLCSIPDGLIYSGGVGRDGIPALSDPVLVQPSDPDAAYLRPHDRVIGIEADGEYIAIPHNILWWHEIVNFNTLEPALSVTYCPLTGSSIVFDRTSVGGVEFGVSGLIFNNNLLMYDRATDGETSLWPQMMRGARCGPRDGQALQMYPATEMRWDGWVRLHPETRVISGETGFIRDYDVYPYGSYEGVNDERTLYPNFAFDRRRPPKERVLGIPFDDGGGIAFPFGLLDAGGPRVVHEVADGEPVVVFWSSEAQAALAFWSSLDGQPLTFEVRDGRYVDVESGTKWGFDGLGLSGAMAGRRLPQIHEAYVAFWFAWATFTVDSELWRP